MAGFVTRFAPSPTGALHLGHAYSAILARDLADAANGAMRVRLEDIDHTRCKPEFEAGVMADLAWLGVSGDGEVRRQSDHLADYANALKTLQDLGVVYRCFKTRAEVAAAIASAPHGPQPVYRGPEAPLCVEDEANRLAAGDAFAWRLSIAAARDHLGPAWRTLAFTEVGAGPQGQTGAIACDPAAHGDIVVARKDAGTSYHIAVTTDDAAQGITHVVRGQDLFSQTEIHVLLQALLGLPTPIYHHHPLVVGPDGARLAKRDKALTLASMRAQGAAPSKIRGWAQSARTDPKRPILAPELSSLGGVLRDNSG